MRILPVVSCWFTRSPIEILLWSPLLRPDPTCIPWIFMNSQKIYIYIYMYIWIYKYIYIYIYTYITMVSPFSQYIIISHGFPTDLPWKPPPAALPLRSEAEVRYSAEVVIDRLRLLTKEHHCLEALRRWRGWWGSSMYYSCIKPDIIHVYIYIDI